MKHKEPTATSIVTEYMRASDDFRTAEQVMGDTRLTNHAVKLSLYYLKLRKVVDCLAEDGKLWWFALPEHEDQRSKVVLERCPETRPRRRLKRKL